MRCGAPVACRVRVITVIPSRASSMHHTAVGLGPRPVLIQLYLREIRVPGVGSAVAAIVISV